MLQRLVRAIRRESAWDSFEVAPAKPHQTLFGTMESEMAFLGAYVSEKLLGHLFSTQLFVVDPLVGVSWGL